MSEYHSNSFKEHTMDGEYLIWFNGKRPDTKVGGLYTICSMSKNESVLAGYHKAVSDETYDDNGNLMECTVANLFFICGKNIITTKADPLCDGSTRQTIIKDIAPNLGYNVIERHILPEDLSEYEQCFITGISTDVMPIFQVDNDVTYKIGKEVLEIRKAFQNLYINNKLDNC